MNKIMGSASKIVFIMIALFACVAFMMGKLTQDNFMILAISAFAFYFGKPNGAPASVVTPPPASTVTDIQG